MSNPSKTKKTKRQNCIGFFTHLGPSLLWGAIATVAIGGAPGSTALAASLSLPPDEPLLANNPFANYSAKTEPAINNDNSIFDGFAIAVDDLDREQALSYLGNLDNILDIGGNAPTPARGPAVSSGGQGKPSEQPVKFKAKLSIEITTPFLESEDNIYQLAANMQPIDYSSFSASGSNTDGDNTGTENKDGSKTGDRNTGSSNRFGHNSLGSNTGSSNKVGSDIGGGNTGSGSGRKKIPEPSTLASVFLAGLSLCCKKRCRR